MFISITLSQQLTVYYPNLKQGNKPTPLSRRRSSTLRQGQRFNSHQNRETQRNCSLLTKLSPELRLLIWELVLGGLRLHIIQRTNRRLGHIVCPASDCDTCECSGLSQPAKDGDLRYDRQNLLGLSKTCNQMCIGYKNIPLQPGA